MPYCTNCGETIESTDTFCKNCGTSTSGGGYNSGSNQNQNNWQNNYGPSNNNHRDAGGIGGTLTIIMVLGIIWALASIIFGIIFFAGFELMYLVGPAIGAICLLGGILALVSCIYIYKLENFKLAFWCCLIGSIIALFTGGIIIGIVGIVFTFLLNSEKYRFKS